MANIEKKKKDLTPAEYEAKAIEEIGQQLKRIKLADLKCTFERVRLGAMVAMAVIKLGVEGAPGRGRGNVGVGALGWWNEHFTKPDGTLEIPYRTVMRWACAARNMTRLMGVTVEAGLKVLANEGVPTVRQHKLLANAEKVANNMTMKELLADQSIDPGTPGRRPGQTPSVPYVKKTPVEIANRMWANLMAEAVKPHLAEQACVLTYEDARGFYDTLAPLMNALKRRIDEGAV